VPIIPRTRRIRIRLFPLIDRARIAPASTGKSAMIRGLQLLVSTRTIIILRKLGVRDIRY
jgi:hypothetical protein